MKPGFKYLPDVWRVYHFVNLKFTVVRAASAPSPHPCPISYPSGSPSVSFFRPFFPSRSPAPELSSHGIEFALLFSFSPLFSLHYERNLPFCLRFSLLFILITVGVRAPSAILRFSPCPPSSLLLSRPVPRSPLGFRFKKNVLLFEHLSEHDRRRVTLLLGSLALPEHSPLRIDSFPLASFPFFPSPRLCSVCLRFLPAYFYSTHLVYECPALPAPFLAVRTVRTVCTIPVTVFADGPSRSYGSAFRPSEFALPFCSRSGSEGNVSNLRRFTENSVIPDSAEQAFAARKPSFSREVRARISRAPVVQDFRAAGLAAANLVLYKPRYIYAEGTRL